jgi:hypothetical protein
MLVVISDGYFLVLLADIQLCIIGACFASSGG